MSRDGEDAASEFDFTIRPGSNPEPLLVEVAVTLDTRSRTQQRKANSVGAAIALGKAPAVQQSRFVFTPVPVVFYTIHAGLRHRVTRPVHVIGHRLTSARGWTHSIEFPCCSGIFRKLPNVQPECRKRTKSYTPTRLARWFKR